MYSGSGFLPEPEGPPIEEPEGPATEEPDDSPLLSEKLVLNDLLFKSSFNLKSSRYSTKIFKISLIKTETVVKIVKCK